MDCGCGGSRTREAGTSSRTLKSIGAWEGKKPATAREKNAARRARQDATKKTT